MEFPQNEETMEGDMSTVGPTYPAHFIVGQAEIKLVADQVQHLVGGTDFGRARNRLVRTMRILPRFDCNIHHHTNDSR